MATVCIVTFNCAQKSCDRYPLELPPAENRPQLIVYAAQEFTSVSAGFRQAIVTNTLDRSVQEATAKAYDGPGYTRLGCHSVGSIVICIYVEQGFVASLDWASTGCGLFGVLGNKGACAVKVQQSGQVSMTFVSAHLNAGEGRAERRNEDYRRICENMIFSDGSGIYETDYLVIAGDLNYRNTTYSSDMKPSLAYDELSAARKAAKTVHGLEEAQIGFSPTYKYTAKGSYSTERVPSYCDRILYYAPRTSVYQYTSLPVVATSDHQPVCLHITLNTGEEGFEQRLIAPFKPKGLQARAERAQMEKFEWGLGMAMELAPFATIAIAAWLLYRVSLWQWGLPQSI